MNIEDYQTTKRYEIPGSSAPELLETALTIIKGIPEGAYLSELEYHPHVYRSRGKHALTLAVTFR